VGKAFLHLVPFSRALLFYFSTTSHRAHVSERKHATSRKVQQCGQGRFVLCLAGKWTLSRHLLSGRDKINNRNYECFAKFRATIRPPFPDISPLPTQKFPSLRAF
jgi:hypothetical protein